MKMKKLISIFATIAILASMFVAPVVKAENTALDIDVWDGTTLDKEFAHDSDGAYLITSAAELAGLADLIFYAADATGIKNTDVIYGDKATGENSATGKELYNAYTGATFKLTKDIDLNNNEWLPIGRRAVRFNATFDGQNHIVNNVKIGNDGTDTNNKPKVPMYVGFFGATGYAANIKNLGVVGVDIKYKNTSNNMLDESLTTQNLGGSNGRVRAAGGFIGAIGGGSVENCFARNVSIINYKTDANGGPIGGFIGLANSIEKHDNNAADAANKNNKTSIKNSYVQNVTLIGASGNKAGFLCYTGDNNQARCQVTIENCYAATLDLRGYAAGVYPGSCGQPSTGRAVAFANAYFVAQQKAANCYTTASKNSYIKTAATETTEAVYDTKDNFTALVAGDTNFITYEADSSDIEDGLVDLSVWYPDADNINGGYPVLKAEEPASLESSVLNGVTFDTIKNTNTDKDYVISDLTLSKTYDFYGQTLNLTWTSTDATVINPDTGVLTQPFNDTEVTLTVKEDKYNTTKSIVVKVPGAFTTTINNLFVANGEDIHNITKSVTLPSSITYDGVEYPISWKSSNETVITPTGTVSKVKYDKTVILTAYTNYPNDKAHTFDCIVRTTSGIIYKADDFDNYAIGTKPEANTDTKWTTANNGTGVDYTIAADPKDPTNNVLKSSRFIMIKDGVRTNVRTGETGLADISNAVMFLNFGESINSGKLQLNARVMFTAPDNEEGSSANNQFIQIGFNGMRNNNDWEGVDIRRNQTAMLSTDLGATSGAQTVGSANAPIHKSNEWYDLTLVVDFDERIYDTYLSIDGTMAHASYTLNKAIGSTTGVFIRSNRSLDRVAEGESVMYVDDVSVRRIVLSDAEKVEYDLAEITMPEKLNDNYELTTEGTEGSSVLWTVESGNATISDGVLVPVFTNTETSITLKATATSGDASASKTYNITLSEKRTYSIGTPQITSGEDTVTELVSGGTVTGATVTLNGVADANDTLYAVLYKDGRFEDIAQASLNDNCVQNTSTLVTFTDALELPQGDLTGYELKLFIWNKSNLAPLADSYTSNLPDTTLWLLGDSTVCHYNKASYPMQGWGEYIDLYMSDRVTKENRAHGGFKVTDYLGTGDANYELLSNITPLVEDGDYAMIALGINDRKLDPSDSSMPTFTAGLLEMATQLKDAGATVVLVTPINCQYNSVTEITREFQNSCNAIKKVANDNGFAYIDLNEAMYDKFVEEMEAGKTRAQIQKDWFMVDVNSTTWPEYVGSPKGNDTTHLNENGAMWTAELVAELLADSTSKLGQYVK